MFCFLFALLNLVLAVENVEVIVGKEFIIELPENLTSLYRWKIDEIYTAAGYVTYVADYVDRSTPEIHTFVFQAAKVGYTTLSFTLVPTGEIETPIFYFPREYEVHVIEKPDTGMISPPDTGMIRPVHKPLQVTVGSEVVIDMMENPTTGYTWKLFDESYATGGFLSYISDFRVEMDGEESTMVGVPLTHRFVFRGEKSGSTKVLFVKVRFGVEAELTPETYFVHVVEKPDTGMIHPVLADVGMIHPVHKPVQVTVGSEVVIDMVENPTTGYTWKFFDDGYTVGGFLSFVGDSMILNENNEKSNFGEPSIHRFVFRGEKCGVARVRFVQARFGEIDVSAAPESYFVRVVEKPDTGMISPPDTGRIRPVHKPLQVTVGSEVVIDMMENPTTGYTWKLFDESYATGGFLSYISDFRVEMDGEESTMVGVPLTHRFVFRGEKSGSTKVRFVQVRFGVEAGMDPETYFVHVVEKPDPGMIGPK